MQLGEIQDPRTGQIDKDLLRPSRPSTSLEMLKQKTKGNLTADEDKFVDNILFDLKMKYVKALSH